MFSLLRKHLTTLWRENKLLCALTITVISISNFFSLLTSLHLKSTNMGPIIRTQKVRNGSGYSPKFNMKCKICHGLAGYVASHLAFHDMS